MRGQNRKHRNECRWEIRNQRGVVVGVDGGGGGSENRWDKCRWDV